jgi:hypothetical protein
MAPPASPHFGRTAALSEFPMKTRWFLVVRSTGQYWVDCEGKSFGPFDTIDEATTSAIRYAEVFADARRQSQVWAPDETGRMRQVWTEDFVRVG